MKKSITKSTIVVACILTFILTLALTMFGVMMVIFFNARQQTVSNFKYAAFSNSGFENTEVAFDANTFKDYISTYDSFNSHTYYNSLNDDEKLVYHIFEYALDHTYCDIFIDTTLLGNCNYNAKQILDMYSLDSPIVEQNIRFTGSKSFSTTAKFTVADISTKVEISGTYYHAPSFEATKLVKKEEAIQKAKDICKLIEEQDSDYDKTKTIFEYLVDHVAYSDEKKFEESDYLYDALCGEETNCDGFANAFSLLANLCGLNSFEKLYWPSDGGDGHTWNCVCIDDVWYNIDASNASSLFRNKAYAEYEKVSELNDYQKAAIYYFWFCVSDNRKSITALYNELIPSCNDDSLDADIEIICEYKDVDVISTISSVLSNAEKPYIIILTDFNIAYDNFKDISKMSGINFGYTSTPLKDGTCIYTIKPKN